jgi:hypothetical protein
MRTCALLVALLLCSCARSPGEDAPAGSPERIATRSFSLIGPCDLALSKINYDQSGVDDGSLELIELRVDHFPPGATFAECGVIGVASYEGGGTGDCKPEASTHGISIGDLPIPEGGIALLGRGGMTSLVPPPDAVTKLDHGSFLKNGPAFLTLQGPAGVVAAYALAKLPTCSLPGYEGPVTVIPPDGDSKAGPEHLLVLCGETYEPRLLADTPLRAPNECPGDAGAGGQPGGGGAAGYPSSVGGSGYPSSEGGSPAGGGGYPSSDGGSSAMGGEGGYPSSGGSFPGAGGGAGAPGVGGGGGYPASSGGSGGASSATGGGVVVGAGGRGGVPAGGEGPGEAGAHGPGTTVPGPAIGCSARFSKIDVAQPDGPSQPRDPSEAVEIEVLGPVPEGGRLADCGVTKFSPYNANDDQGGCGIAAGYYAEVSVGDLLVPASRRLVLGLPGSAVFPWPSASGQAFSVLHDGPDYLALRGPAGEVRAAVAYPSPDKPSILPGCALFGGVAEVLPADEPTATDPPRDQAIVRCAGGDWRLLPLTAVAWGQDARCPETDTGLAGHDPGTAGSAGVADHAAEAGGGPGGGGGAAVVADLDPGPAPGCGCRLTPTEARGPGWGALLAAFAGLAGRRGKGARRPRGGRRSDRDASCFPPEGAGGQNARHGASRDRSRHDGHDGTPA